MGQRRSLHYTVGGQGFQRETSSHWNSTVTPLFAFGLMNRLPVAGGADYLLLSLYTPHHDYGLQDILDWGSIIYHGNNIIEIQDVFPPSWKKKNRLNNVAIAIAPRYNFVVLYDDKGESEMYAL
jgi:hypothetical protein